MKIFYILNGSNDLYNSILDNLNLFLKFMSERPYLEGYCIFKIEDCDYLNIWANGERLEFYRGVYEIREGRVKKLGFENFSVREEVFGREIEYIDVEKFLRVYMRDEDFNVVAISGHGGPFQALLDMKEAVPFSINTYNLANILNKRKIEYLILDMCSMNYIEVVYEILYGNNIKNVITYRSFAPMEGVGIENIIKCIDGGNFKEDFFELESLLVCLDKEDVRKLDLFRVSQNKKILELLNKRDKEFKRGIYVLRTEEVKIGTQTRRGKALSGGTLGYIKYFLQNESERRIYSRFKYTINNLWNIVVRGEFKVYEEKINIIALEKEGLLNIISSYVDEEEALELCEEYLKIKIKMIKGKEI
ncbi:MAG: hypothetical protein ACRC28_06485 [Clostridium sp.]|uniref:hypothetical protein n=1 Tax=Clostridium sp. TaxID=1506 RepID=UPI003F3626D6